jgi:predicted transposase YdaD
MSEISNPHDKFFKEMFSQPELTRDFPQNYLPTPVLAQIELN